MHTGAITKASRLPSSSIGISDCAASQGIAQPDHYSASQWILLDTDRQNVRHCVATFITQRSIVEVPAQTTTKV